VVGAVLVRLVLITLVIGAALQPDAASTAFAVRQTGDAAARAIPHSRGERGRDDATQPAASSTVKASTAIAYPDGPALPWSPGETSSIDVMVNNDTGATWTAAGADAMRLSYHLYDASGGLLAWDGLRTMLPFDVLPGQRETVALTVAVTPVRAIEGGPAPFDSDLMRLAEILGALHYLRTLCGANEGNKWRDQMSALIDAEAQIEIEADAIVPPS